MRLDILCKVLLRVFLPLCLLGSTISRFNGFSFMHLIMLLICPLVRCQLSHQQTKGVTIYLIILIITSGCFTISMSAVNIYIIFNKQFLSNCSDSLTVDLHQFGIVNLRGVNYNRILRLVLPDIVTFFFSIILLVLFSKLNSLKKSNIISGKLDRNDVENECNYDVICKNENYDFVRFEEIIPLQTGCDITYQDDKLSSAINKDYKRRTSRELFQSNNYMRKTIGIDELHNRKLKHWLKQNLFVFFNIVVTGFAGIISPSLLNSIYLLSYLGIGTFWACGKFVITQHFARMRICLLLYSAFHVCLIYLVQIEFMQNYLPNGDFKSRLLGLYYLFDTSCSKRGEFIFNKERWIDYFSPFVIMYVYYLCAIETRRWVEEHQKITVQNPIIDKDTINKTESLLSGDEMNQDESETLHKIERTSRHSSVNIGPIVDFADIPTMANNQNSRSTLIVEEDVTKLEETKKGQRPLLLSLINTLIGNSFIFTFIAMMAWSVAYKSWMSFIFLLSACFLWMMPNSRNFCLYASPGIVMYAIVLIIIQYIYGFNLHELPTKFSNVSEMEFSEIGLQRWEIPTGTLAVMMSFLVMFWLTLRLFMTNKRNKNIDLLLTTDSYESDHIAYKKFVKFLNEISEQYWIFMCCFSMLFVSIYGSVVIFRIVYMILLIYFLLVFMLFYSFWRKQMNVFWWVVIGYSVVVLLCIYVFQVERISITVQNFTGFSEETLQDIGLTRYKASNLLQGLFTPVIFLVILIVQVRYFHEKFLMLSSLTENRQIIPPEEKNNTEVESNRKNIYSNEFINDVNEDVQSLLQKLKVFYKSHKPAIWRFFECHFIKLVAFIIVYVCIIDVNAINIVLIILVVIGFPFPRLHSMMVTGSFIWCSLQVILKMIYQIKHFQKLNWLTNCSQFDYFANSSSDKIDNAKWIGLVKVDHFHSYILKLAVIIVLCSIWHVIKYRQKQYYKFNNVEYPNRGIVFPEINIDSSIENFSNLFRYSLNFSFYKIGLELSFVSTVIVSCLRIDVYSLIYLILLFIFLFLKKETCKKLWLPYLIFLGVLLPIQYVICIGLPPGLCIEYPFKMLSSKLRKWLYLPSYKTSPVSGKIMVDMLQYVFVALQYQAFRNENHYSYKSKEIKNNQKTTYKDFITIKSSYIDYLKHAVFYWSYWLTLAIIFITGVFWITLFGLGYLIISFIYLWLGHILLIGKRKNIIRSFNVILYYNFLVILTKCTFQLIGCVYINLLIDKDLCWMVSLFGIQCINPMSWEVRDIHVKETNKQCFSVASGLHWDVICFFFIILQKKIFKASPFLLVRLDIHVQNKFSSRGALYINQEMMKSIEEQKKMEEKELEKIEKKIEAISKRQAQHGKPQLTEHYLALRSGDYYLFDEDLDEEDKKDETNYDNIENSDLPFMSDDEISKSLENTRNSSVQSSFDLNFSTKKFNENIIKLSPTNFQDIPENNESENSDDDFDLPQLTLNPVQLLNKVIYDGPRSAVRQYKRSISESREAVTSRRSSVVCRKNSETCVKCANQNVCQSGSIREDSFHSSTQNDNSIIYSQPLNIHLHTPIPSESETYLRTSNESINNDSLDKNRQDFTDNVVLESCWKKFKNGIKLVFCFINSCMKSLIDVFNRWTQKYSKIIKKIEKEKKLVKEVVLSKIDKIDEKLGQEIDKIVSNQETQLSVIENYEEKLKEKKFLYSKSAFFSLIISFGNVAIIYSEFMCYFILIFNHLLSGNLLSLPYPLLVFFWAMLSVPRPSKNFWILIITYTEIVIVIKYIFQFNIITFNMPPDPKNRINPLSLPIIIGIEKTRTNAIIDVIQLMFLFLHRSFLKTNGLWRDHTEFYEDHANIKKENDGEDHNEELLDLNNRHKIGKALYNPIKQIRKFYSKMTNPKLNKRVDVYSFMFLCEFVSILIIIIGYNSFGPGTDSGVHAIDFIKSSKTPVPFIAMIITQFIFFIIDRALFLRKQVKGKFVFQIFHVLLIHAWLFFALPYITKRKFNSQFPQLLYFFKCIYFALSAYQLKSGYPMKILGNFLTKKYNYFNLIMFKIYMGIPFLFELRNVMDWMWTDSTIAFYHWMEVEDIFSKIFVLKCWRYGEKKWPTERGRNRRLISKYSVGIALIFFFSLCIWGPLMISSFIGVTFVKYPPVECSFSINVGDYSPIFVFSTRENNMKQLSKNTLEKMKQCYNRHSSSTDFLQSFEPDDATEIIIDNASDNAWLITPPGLQNLKQKLSYLNESLKINMQAVCERQTTDSKSTEKIVRFTQSRILSYEEKIKFLVAINTTENPTDVHLATIFPRFLTAYKRTLSETTPLHRNENYTYLNISLSLKMYKSIMWWEISELIYGKAYCSKITESRKKYSFLTIFIFNERISDNIFGHIFSNYGIIGIYAAYFFVVHRFLRTFYSNIAYIVPYEELPNVDRIHKLLHEIYLVRENKKLLLEEELIAKLIFLFRSSQTMIKWTQHKKSTLLADIVKENQV